MEKVAVLGAGNGGQAIAALLKQTGYQVALWNRGKAAVDLLNQNGRRVTLEGAASGTAILDQVTTDIAEAVRGSQYIFVALPAFAHGQVARQLLGLLDARHTVILNPGRTAGALEVASILWKHSPCTILETQSLLCACRADAGKVRILSFKKENLFAGFPQHRVQEAIAGLPPFYAAPRVATTTLQTGLDNMGAILHPGPVLLNSGWIESRKAFFPHYYFGISPSVAALLEKMDAERMELANALSVEIRSVKQWHEDMYEGSGANLYHALQANAAYASIDAPKTLSHRYVTEDVPTGLVPMLELGKLMGLQMPIMETIVTLAEAMLGMPFRADGRNLHRLGLENMTVRQVKRRFMEGPTELFST